MASISYELPVPGEALPVYIKPSLMISYGMAVMVAICTFIRENASRGPLGRRLVGGAFSAAQQGQEMLGKRL